MNCTILPKNECQAAENPTLLAFSRLNLLPSRAQVLKFLCETGQSNGLTMKKIAESLDLSRRTVYSALIDLERHRVLKRQRLRCYRYEVLDASEWGVQ